MSTKFHGKVGYGPRTKCLIFHDPWPKVGKVVGVAYSNTLTGIISKGKKTFQAVEGEHGSGCGNFPTG